MFALLAKGKEKKGRIVLQVIKKIQALSPTPPPPPHKNQMAALLQGKRDIWNTVKPV